MAVIPAWGVARVETLQARGRKGEIGMGKPAWCVLTSRSWGFCDFQSRMPFVLSTGPGAVCLYFTLLSLKAVLPPHNYTLPTFEIHQSQVRYCRHGVLALRRPSMSSMSAWAT